MSAPKVALGAALLVTAIVSVAAISNHILDGNETADQPGATVQQRKEMAQRNQEEYKRPTTNGLLKLSGWFSSSDTSRMCADTGIVNQVIGLIKDDIPNMDEFGQNLVALDKARDGGVQDVIKAREDHLRQTKEMYLRDPIEKSRFSADQEALRTQHLAELEDELSKLRAKKAAEDARVNPVSKPGPKLEIIIVNESVPVAFDRDINRVKCRLNFRIRGGGYDGAWKGLIGDQPIPASYTIQPGKDDWIVILLPE